jgi:hypothetical protein
VVVVEQQIPLGIKPEFLIILIHFSGINKNIFWLSNPEFPIILIHFPGLVLCQGKFLNGTHASILNLNWQSVCEIKKLIQDRLDVNLNLLHEQNFS